MILRNGKFSGKILRKIFWKICNHLNSLPVLESKNIKERQKDEPSEGDWWSRVVCEKLIVTHLVNKFHVLHGTSGIVIGPCDENQTTVLLKKLKLSKEYFSRDDHSVKNIFLPITVVSVCGSRTSWGFAKSSKGGSWKDITNDIFFCLDKTINNFVFLPQLTFQNSLI
jgi:hypothetical protein